ncbi:hypothetical protein C8J57DRAFT_1716441 [Mycena rebaudengoi]|jgi:hypothetical protein|nr:hypothetical protein C8J57DRAFT_1716441 [Mycena rebaudengoi]
MAASPHDHSPPSPAGSSASDGSSNSTAPPQTPGSTSPPFAMPTFMNFTSEDTLNGNPSLSAGGAKRPSKTTRRINTAERRATHNAVERQRRENLNGRFLDLAALLSNLNQIRRPSKSAIVNSSIAHLNASRRHRILAAQQLRMLKAEADSLRHEVNEWRMRAGLNFVEEPLRSDAFGIVIRGELEFEAGDMVDAGDEGDEDEELGGGNSGVYGGRRYGGEQAVYSDEPEDYLLLQRQQQERAEMMAHAHALAQAQAQAQMQMQPPFVHTVAHPSASSNSQPPPNGYAIAPVHLAQAASAHYYSPNIVDPAEAAFENPAIGYEHQLVANHQEPGNANWAFDKHQLLHAQQQRQASW